MALWKDPAAKDSPTGTTEPAAASPEPALRVVDRPAAGTEPQRKTPSGPAKESLIAGDITIEGKIEGSGHVRIAGRFKGDVNVQGDLSLERGAKLNGGVRAKKVIVAGELEGNIESAARVELLETAVLIGDTKAGTLTVAAGAKIRGHVDCGWESTSAPKPDAKADAAEG